jgi:hypothetical protein
MRPAIACAAGSSCRASALATATWSASDLCWLSLKLPAMVSTVISTTMVARISISRRSSDIRSGVQAGFGASQLSKCPLSASI